MAWQVPERIFLLRLELGPCAVARLDWREFLVPGTTLWQLFVYDPSGVQLELTFEGSAEAGPPPDMSEGRRYVAGESFFRAS